MDYRKTRFSNHVFKFGISAILLWISTGFNFLHAQQQDSGIHFTGINIHQDPKIDLILEKRKEFGRKSSISPMGYRLLVYSGNKRQEANQDQTSIKQLLPTLETYLTYSFPNFKLHVGDFKTKEDAIKVSEAIKQVLSLNPIPIFQKIDLSKVNQSN
jgi:hypothetical protein